MVCLAACLATLGVTTNVSAGVITKSPDLGSFWNPLNSGSGTYIYANSFIAPNSGFVTNIGSWFNGGGNGSDVVLQVYASIGSNPLFGPDSTNLLATTGVISGISGALAYYNAPTLAGGTALVGGQVYWFGANVIGQASSGNLQVGGHTQNTSVVDNGTFWYSNDPTGVSFDGQNLTPEMAFSVTVEEIAAVPEPTSIAVWGIGALGGCLLARRRKKLA